MTSVAPPTYYFNGIQYNSNFFSSSDDSITQAYANQNYLKRVGVPSSIASLTTFNNAVTTNGTLTSNGNLAAVGNVTTTGTLTANGNVTTNGTLTTVGAVTANGNVTTNANLTANSTIFANSAIDSNSYKINANKRIYQNTTYKQSYYEPATTASIHSSRDMIDNLLRYGNECVSMSARTFLQTYWVSDKQLWYVLCDDKKIYTTPDGINFTALSNTFSGTLQSFAFVRWSDTTTPYTTYDRLIVGCSDGCFYSDNGGSTYTQTSTYDTPFVHYISEKNYVLAVHPFNSTSGGGSLRLNNIERSTDRGLTWTPCTTLPTKDANYWGQYGIVWAPELDRFVVNIKDSSSATTRNQRTCYSSDGINWTLQATPSVSGFQQGLAYANHLGLFITLTTTPDSIIYSYDGINWSTTTNYKVTTTNAILDLKYFSSLKCFVFVNSGVQQDVTYSRDGFNWYTIDFDPTTNSASSAISYSPDLGAFLYRGRNPSVVPIIAYKNYISRYPIPTLKNTKKYELTTSLSGNQMINVKFFGAVGDGIVDDTTAIQNAINYANPFGYTVYFPSGKYKISSALSINNTTDTAADDYKTSLRGESTSSTQIIGAAGSYNMISFLGGNTSGQYSYQIVSNLLIYKQDLLGAVFLLDNLIGFRMENCVISGAQFGIYASDVTSSCFINCSVSYSSYGLKLERITTSRPNDINLFSCSFNNNDNYAITAVDVSTFNMIGGSVIANGITGSDPVTVGIALHNVGYDGASGGTIEGVYFAGNKGICDLYVNNTDVGGSINVSGCSFIRASSVAYVVNNIAIEATGANIITCNISGCGFGSSGTYTVNSSRRYLVAHTSTSYISWSGCYFESSTEIPTISNYNFCLDPKPSSTCLLGYTNNTSTAITVALTTTVVANVLSLSIPAGVYNVQYLMQIQYTGAGHNITSLRYGLSTSNSAFVDNMSEGLQLQTIPFTNNAIIKNNGSLYVNNASATTYYLLVQATLSGGTFNAGGNILFYRVA